MTYADDVVRMVHTMNAGALQEFWGCSKEAWFTNKCGEDSFFFFFKKTARGSGQRRRFHQVDELYQLASVKSFKYLGAFFVIELKDVSSDNKTRSYFAIHKM